MTIRYWTLTIAIAGALTLNGCGGTPSDGSSPAPDSNNSAPAISGTPATVILVNTPYTFTPTASDKDHDALHFTITHQPNWATFDPNTGKLSGTPSNADAGVTRGIVITVSDGIAQSSLPPFDLEVKFQIASCGISNDKGLGVATLLTAGQTITRRGASTARIRLWHLSDTTRKACILSGQVEVK